MQQTASSEKSPAKKHSRKRQTVPVSIWISPAEKAELKRIAESDGLSVSRTGRAILVDGIRQRLRLEREVLAQPILEAFFDKKLNRLMNRLAEILGRSLFETGQMRWLYVNTLYHDTLRRIGSETNPQKKEALQKEFYKLLDTSQQETLKAIKHWNPHIKDVVATMKQWLQEGEET